MSKPDKKSLMPNKIYNRQLRDYCRLNNCEPINIPTIAKTLMRVNSKSLSRLGLEMFYGDKDGS